MLGEAALADQAKEDGDDDPIGSADDEGKVGSKQAGEEGEGETEVGDSDVEKDVVNAVHLETASEGARLNIGELLVSFIAGFVREALYDKN